LKRHSSKIPAGCTRRWEVRLTISYASAFSPRGMCLNSKPWKCFYIFRCSSR
jgi:hypothetical protein